MEGCLLLGVLERLRDAFSVSMERVWSIHPDCSVHLSVKQKELLSFFSSHLCDSPWHQILQPEDLIEYPLVKWLLHASRSPAYCTIYHSFFGSRMTRNYTELGAAQLKSIKML